MDRIDTFAQQVPQGSYFLTDTFQKDLIDIARAHSEAGAHYLKKALIYEKKSCGKDG